MAQSAPFFPACPSCEAPELAFAVHDHGHCQSDALSRAEAVIAARGLRLTPVRRRVLEILLESHRAIGAYDVLNRLVAEGFGNQPPVAYRALDFLEEQGLAHRIRRLNAFCACMHPGEAHAPAFLICQNCNGVAEAPAAALRLALNAAADQVGFTVEGSNIEAVGQCAACRGQSA